MFYGGVVRYGGTNHMMV
jgi:hypothetical protein